MAVYQDDRSKPWMARVNRGGKTLFLGRFETREQAERAEEDWWANPLNVPYEAWRDRLITHMLPFGRAVGLPRRTILRTRPVASRSRPTKV